MTTHSSILAWKIPWTDEPGRLQSMRSQSRTQLSDFTSLLECVLGILLEREEVGGGRREHLKTRNLRMQ